MAFEGVGEGIGVGEALFQNQFADLDVPERTGVVEAAFAECDQEDEPDGEEERRFGPEQSLHRVSLRLRTMPLGEA